MYWSSTRYGRDVLCRSMVHVCHYIYLEVAVGRRDGQGARAKCNGAAMRRRLSVHRLISMPTGQRRSMYMDCSVDSACL